jgi:hypothetical protein
VTPTGNNTTTVIDDNSLVVTEQDSETGAIVTNLTILPEGDDGFNALFASADGMISGEPSSEVDVQVDHENQTISIPVTDSNGNPVTMTVDLNTGETTYQAPEGHSYVFGVLTPDAVDDHPVGGDSSGYPARPGRPSGIKIHHYNYKAVKISWGIYFGNNNHGARSQIRVVDKVANKVVARANTLSRNILAGDLQPETVYIVKIFATNAQGRGPTNYPYTFRTQSVPGR